ncbi:hypothetical protein K439DRAFT_1536138 [Ramaria rubella]|nr:hypothetical protein K439DRAFT_1536138 [Ramaria rubella]
MGIGKLARRNSKRPSHNSPNVSFLHDIGEDDPRDVKTRQEQSRLAGDSVVKKIDWEIPRKTLHASIGFFVVPLYTHGYSTRPIIIGLTGALVVISAADALRLHNAAFSRFYGSCLGFLMRDSEKHKINGVIWYILGALVALIAYPLDIAVVSILVLSWADTTASTFGRLWGRYTPALPSHLPIIPFLPTRFGLPLAPRKSLAGFIAASLTSGIVAFGFWGWLAPVRGSEAVWTWDNPVVGGWFGLGMLSVATAIVGGVVEALDLGDLDDNLTLPAISGAVLWSFLRGVISLF